jgi:8-amino-7-oxononanoate synthase
MGWESFFRVELNKLKERSLYRSLEKIETRRGSKLKIGGQEFLSFSSNDYLGLSQHAEVKAEICKWTALLGASSASSRLLAGNLILLEELEQKISEMKGTEQSLVFSSGYLANVSVIAALLTKEDLAIADRFIHASLIDGIRLSQATLKIYSHTSLESLEKILTRYQTYRKKLIITESVFSMDGDIAPIKEILDLARKYQAFLLVDDAHATGVLGERGGGIVEHLKIKSENLIQIGTLSKAVGSLGGFAAAQEVVIDYLRNFARSFIYSTALSPPVAAAALKGIELIQRQPSLRRHLWENTDYFKKALLRAGFNLGSSQTPIIPLLIGDSEKALTASRFLKREGIWIPAIRPPTVPKGTARLRITLTATHTQEELEILLKALRKMKKELKI